MSNGQRKEGLLKVLLSSERFPFDLILVIILSLITLVVVGLSEISPEDSALKPLLDACRILFGIPFLIFLPGYALVSALWPQKSIEDADNIDNDTDENVIKSKEEGISNLERIALSFGLSIAIIALTGLGLNYTPWGITLTSIIISLGALILIIVGIAWFRRSKLNQEERFVVRVEFLPPRFNTLSSTDKVMVILIIFSIIIGGGVLAYVATNPPQEQFTELYLLDVNGTTENYPTNLSVDEEGTIIIGVVCHERQATDYDILIRLVSEDGSFRILDEYYFSLDDEEEWSQTYSFSVDEGGTFKLVVDLFLHDEDMPYLTNHLWIYIRG